MNAATQRHLRGVQRSVSDLLITRDSIIEKVKSSSSPARSWKQPFDLDEDNITAGNLRILPRMTDTTPYVMLRGALKAVSCGTGFSLDGTTYCATLTSSVLVYLKYSRATAGVSIESAANAAAAFVTPDDYSYRPLWYIVVASGAIVLDDCVSLRESFVIEGIS